MKGKRVILFLLVVVLLAAMGVSCSKEEKQNYPGLGATINAYQEYKGWVYYIDYNTLNLYKTKPNGEKRILIIDESVYSFIIYEDRIFYTNFQYYLHSANIDGSDVGKLKSINAEFLINNEIRAKKMQIVDGWIYVLFEPTLYKIKTDGSGGTLINFHEFMSDYNIEGDKIFYCKQPRNGQASGLQLWQMGLDGARPQPLMKESAVAIDYDEDWIYYISTEDDDIYRVSYDGNEKRKLVEGNCTYIKVLGDWIYYGQYGEAKGIYRIREDGSENTYLKDDYLIYQGTFNQWFLFYGDEITAIKFSESSETEKFTYDIISEWPVTDIYE